MTLESGAKGGRAGVPEARNISALNLAFIGDAVFELLARAESLRTGPAGSETLGKRARGLVNAGAQARMYRVVEPVLTEDELAVLRRGRNAKSAARAKNAPVVDYRHATGLEALFGYLYLAGRIDRIYQLFELCVGESQARE